MNTLIGIALGLVLVALSYTVSRIRNDDSRTAATCMLCLVTLVASFVAIAVGLHDGGRCIVPCEEASE